MSVFQRTLLGRKPGARLQGQFLTAAFQGVQPGKSSGMKTLSKQSREGAWGLRGLGVGWGGVRCPWLMAERDSHRCFIRPNFLPQSYRNVASIYILEKMSVLFLRLLNLEPTQRAVGGRAVWGNSHIVDRTQMPQKAPFPAKEIGSPSDRSWNLRDRAHKTLN